MRGDDVAVVGIGCRFGTLRGPDELWEALLEGRDLVRPAPQDGRFDAERYLKARTRGGRRLLSSAAGSFIEGYELFDAEYFGISPFEASRLDPQHRLMLQTAAEAVEDSGIPARKLSAGRTGVFTVQLTSHYWDDLYRAGVWDLHTMTGAIGRGNLPARIAHTRDLHGPAVAVDATCSSSLLAVHLACQALRLGDIDAAIVGAVNLITAVEDGVVMSQGNLLSASSRCRFGDEGADGFVRSDGVACVVLKPLTQAQADGDRIYAVILGGAATHEGAWTSSFVSPSVTGRSYMLRAACESAGVDPRELDYVEAHGAGTPTGDQTELAALAAEYGAVRGTRDPLLVGSVKTNIGHTEATAGLAGLIKVALSLRHKRIPATLHVRSPTSAVDWEHSGLQLARQPTDWPADKRPIAGASAFGISGSNVHVLLGAAPDPVPAEAARTRRPADLCLLPLSAHVPAALDELAQGYARQLSRPEAAERIADISYTAGERRDHRRHRAAVVGANESELLEGLAGLAPTAAFPNPRVVFVFPGHGAQRAGMAAELMRESPLFASALEIYDKAVQQERGWSVAELLRSGDPFTDVAMAQPALWAVECALASMWQQWGVEPDVVVGHSMGEVAAATIAGALSVADAAAVICRRSSLMMRTARSGGLLAVRLGAQEAERFIAGHGPGLTIAASNSPASTVLAGSIAALAEAEHALDEGGIRHRRVNADVASHSAAMDPVLDDLRSCLSGIRPMAGRFPIASTVRPAGQPPATLTGTEMDAEYWVRNLRESVQFAETLKTLLTDGVPTVFIELSPTGALVPAVQECIDEADARAAVVGALLRSEPGLRGALNSLGRAYAVGVDPDWAAVNGEGDFLAPPLYPWQASRFTVADAKPNLPGHLMPRDSQGQKAKRPVTRARRRAFAGVGAAKRVPGASTIETELRAARQTQRPGPRPASSSSGSGPRQAPGLRLGQGDHALADSSRPRLTAAELEQRLTVIAADILGLPADRVERDRPLAELGMDSLLAMELRARASSALGVRIDHLQILSGRTLRELATGTDGSRDSTG
ncbi:type I polyketide synthase [Actinospica robiniae]|uniref:type I polyketide synthase n=1 Tax=Actinospica robiniae TaxID=304901 RepID=UPI0004237E21|nr:type I polyketide synthase [Actinospica robiniae]